jgi:hypothetical protein
VNKNFIVRGTTIRKKTRGFFLAILHPDMIRGLKGVRGNRLVLVNHQLHDRIFSIPALLQADSSVPAGEICLDQKLREALSADKGEKVFLIPFIHKKGPACTRIINRIFGIQTNILCVRVTNKTDMELPLCRITRQTMETIGVESGDTIIVQAKERSLRIKAYELTEDIIQTWRAKHPEAAQTPLSWIMMDLDARRELGAEKDDPVMIYRDLNYMAGKKVHLLSEPLVLTIIGATLGFDLSFNWQMGILSLGLFLVIIFNFIGLRKR